MRILLTGAAGFIGTEIARQLAEAGHDVVGVDALIAQAHGPGAELPDGVQQGDVREADSWGSLWEGVDVVCHQAAMVGAGVTVADLPQYAAHNDLGTAALLAAMSARGIDRMVLASSMVVYGEGRYTCPTHGERRPGPRAVADLDAGRFDNALRPCADKPGLGARPRGRAARPAEQLRRQQAGPGAVRAGLGPAGTGGRSIALRYHNVYGPGMPRDTPYSGVAAIFRSALERGDAPRVFEDGGQMRDFVHVRDVARANVLALERVGSSGPGHAAYNVCSGRPIAIAEVARRSSGRGREPLVTGEYRLGDVRHIVASPSLAADELGFVAQVMPEEGLAEFRTAPLRA